MTIRTLLVTALVLGMSLLQVAHAMDRPLADVFPVADGKTPYPTGHGTTVIPPPGSPTLIVPVSESYSVIDPPSFGITALSEMRTDGAPPALAGAGLGNDEATVDACNNYRVGWYMGYDNTVYGGHMKVNGYNDNSFTYFCTGHYLAYTDGVSFGANSWIQAGVTIRTGETSHKWFCQANDNGDLSDTHFGPANEYFSGTTVYTWFARDSGGTWRTYVYDTGPYAEELPCDLARDTGSSLQFLWELTGATSGEADMGPWRMSDFRYLDTNGQWYIPYEVTPFWAGSASCPQYGTDDIYGDVTLPGSYQTCTTTTQPYG